MVEFNDRAARLAGLFSANGVTNGASVGMYMLNCNEYTEAHFGCFKQSVCPVNVNYRYRAEELIYLLDNSDSEVVIFHASYAPRIKKSVIHCRRLSSTSKSTTDVANRC